MTEHFERIVGVRLLASQAILQNVIRSWGESKEVLLDELQRTREALVATCMQQDMTDEQLDWLRAEFDMVIHSLRAAIQGLPDDRPRPV